MTISTPPWCLHWGRDGELAAGDRQDLLSALVFRERGMARLMLTQALQMGACSNQQPPMTQRHNSASMTP